MDILVKEAAKLPQPTNKVLLRPHQMVQHEEDIRQCDADLANAGVKMKGIVRQRKKALEKQYLEQAPNPSPTEPCVTRWPSVSTTWRSRSRWAFRLRKRCGKPPT